MLKVYSAIFSLLLPFLLFAKETQARDACLGPKDAGSAWIYLHGMDSPNVGDHELRIRDLLSNLAQVLKLRIAAPRGNQLCNGKTCWKHAGAAEAHASIQGAIAKSKACLGERPLIGIVGFSNGGYLANKYFQSCRHEKPLHYYVSGALGELSSQELSSLDNKKNCGHLTLAIGKADQIWKRVEALHQKLLKLYPGRVSLQLFQGGHDLNGQNLKAWFHAASKSELDKLQK